MARSIQEIYDEIIQEKEDQTSLDGLIPNPENFTNLLDSLTSTSKVAIWRLWAFITAVAMSIQEKSFDIFKLEVESIAASAKSGTPPWYQKKMFEFQYGDSLVYADFQYNYATVNPELQIIKRCAVEERSDGAVIIKAAKEDGGGNPVPLELVEKTALESYAHKIKFPGRLAISSLNADTLSVAYNVYFDPLIPKATIISNMQSAIDDFLSNLDFNAEFRVTNFTDVLQAVNGVVDPVFQSATATPDGGSPVAFAIRYLPASGYFELADTIENMFTFIEQI